MPTYVYEREDGTRFEIQQRITDEALEHCPETNLECERVIHAPSITFNGSGFYQTDYNGANPSS